MWQYKQELLIKNNIAVWRFHDYLHSHRPDGVLMGLLTALGWEKYYDVNNSSLITLPPTSLRDIIQQCKSKLGITNLRVIGDATQVCKRIALIPGAAGGTKTNAIITK